MKISVYNIIRTRISNGHAVHSVIGSSTIGPDLQDTMDHLYDNVIPARAMQRGEINEGYDWLNDIRFEYLVYRMVDGVKTFVRTEVYEIVESEVEVA